MDANLPPNGPWNIDLSYNMRETISYFGPGAPGLFNCSGAQAGAMAAAITTSETLLQL